MDEPTLIIHTCDKSVALIHDVVLRLIGCPPFRVSCQCHTFVVGNKGNLFLKVVRAESWPADLPLKGVAPGLFRDDFSINCTGG